MGDKSRIEWTDASWNPIRARCAGKVGWHCEKVSEGCRNCYAEGMNKRLGTGRHFKPGELQPGRAELFLDEKMLTQPLRWKKPRRIFVCSIDLVRDLRDQCAGAGVLFFLKQLHIDGGKVAMPELDGRVLDQMPGGAQ